MATAPFNPQPLSDVESGCAVTDAPDRPQPHASVFQKVIAELVGTYILVFAGCGSVVANALFDGAITFPGVCLTWGLTVMALIYTVGHVSEAHFNPGVTLTKAIFQNFPWKEVIFYVLAQLVGSLLASYTLDLMFNVTKQAYFGTRPSGSDAQSLSIEIITSFMLMFVILGSTNDSPPLEQLQGVAVGLTVTIDVFIAGKVSGASMNPARSIGPALVKHEFRALWVYIVGPVVGMVAAGVVHTLLQPENNLFDKFLRRKLENEAD